MNGNYHESLIRRQKALGMSFPSLSERTGVSVLTLKRILHGKAENPTLRSLQSIAAALGVEIRINGRTEVVVRSTALEFRECAAKEKANKIVRLVQGTSALESQAVDPATFQSMVGQTVHDLMSGSGRRLWSS